ncbi:addiction module protein [Solidesulfovibrio sp.]|uniref:addiction module protein n=1 Tax=Solidesulfovibrio sp. TaxID=2910990 RepID=UPI002628A111|nr:addiction module protein [Solidesulfovibrio sp.]
MKTDARLVRQVLDLGPLERAELIEVLQASFDEAGDAAMEAAWGHEAESRLDAYAAGSLRAVRAADVFGKIVG